MAGKPRVLNADVVAANEIYTVAQEAANQKLQKLQEEVDDIRQESFAQGAIRAMDSMTAYNELMKFVTLFNIKKHKEYRSGGLTWDGFCESLGLDRRNVDNILNDLAPIVKDFSEKLSVFCGMPFNKIRHLGRAISGNFSEIQNGAICYGGETILLAPENADEIQALLDVISEDAKKATEDSEATIRAKDRVLKSKEDVIKKQEKELARFERQAKAKGLSPEEDAILARIETLGVELNGYCLSIENVHDALIENPFPNALAAFITLMDNVKMRTSAFREAAVELTPAGMVEDEWMPPGVAIES